MANLYTFDKVETIKDPSFPKSSKAVAAVQKALTGNKIPKTHVDKFTAELKKFNFSPYTSAAFQYMEKNQVGNDLKPSTPNPNMVQRALTIAFFAPQRRALIVRWDLSVHLKGNNLELQHTDCKGSTQVLLTVGP